MDPNDTPDDDQAAPSHPVVNCQMCGCQVEERHTTVMVGRRICFGCAAAWFEDEAD